MRKLASVILLIGIVWQAGLPASSQASRAEENIFEAHMTRGAELLEQQQFEQAASELEQAVKLNPKSSPAFYNLGLAYWKLRKVELASVAFNNALSSNSSDIYSQYYLGRIHLLKGDTSKAIALFESLANRDSIPVADEQYQLGQAYLAAGNVAKAIHWLQKAVELNPREGSIRSALGRAYQLAGRKADAEQEFETASQIKNQDLQLTQLLHQCRQYLQSKEVDKALQVRNQLMESGEVDYLIAAGTIFGENGLAEYAVEPLKKAVALNPKSFEAQFNLGYTYLGIEKETLAEEHLHQAALVQPDSFEAHSLLGVARANLKKNLPAIESLRKATQLRPDNLKVSSLLALQYIEGRYYAEAIPLLNRSIQLNDTDPSLRFLLVQAHYKNQDTERALEVAKMTVERFPGLARSHFELGFQLATMGRFQESRPHFDKALELDPQYPEAHYWLGDLLLKEGKPEEAVSYFRNSLQKNPNYLEAYSGLAKALLDLKRYDEVLAAMGKAVAIDPEEPQPHLHLAQAYRALGQQEEAQRESQIFARLNRERMKRKDQETIQKFLEH